MKDFARQYEEYRQAVETYLNGLYAGEPPYADLYESVRYSLLAGGKRIRPVLTLAFAAAGGADWRQALPVACAFELMHTASLIHDDLPCMDNDDLRRGRPTNHKVYGETMAILASDALQQDAYRLILSAPVPDAKIRADCALILARAAGSDAMVGGQVLDTLHAPQTLDDIRLIHRLKTGAMIAGSCQAGAAFAGNPALLDAAETYGQEIGLAFQIRDDVLDVTGDAAELGKPVGSDRESGKVTYVDLLGAEACGTLARECTENAVSAVAPCDADGFLAALARSLAERTK